MTYLHLCHSKTRMYFNDKGLSLAKTLSGSKITRKLSSKHQWDCSIAPYSIRNIHYIGLPILAQRHMLLESKKCTWIPTSDFPLNCVCLTVLSKWSTFVKKQNSFMEAERKDQRKQNKQIWFRRCSFMVQGKRSWQLLKQNSRNSTSTGKGVLINARESWDPKRKGKSLLLIQEKGKMLFHWACFSPFSKFPGTNLCQFQ